MDRGHLSKRGSTNAHAIMNATLTCKDHFYYRTLQQKCLPCPIGGYCIGGHVTDKNLQPMFGFSRCFNSTLKFTHCKGSACLGRPNPDTSLSHYPLALVDHNQSRCNVGHANSTDNVRCSTCALGYAPSSTNTNQGSCDICGGGIAVLLLFAVAAVLLFLALIAIKFRSHPHKKALHSTLKRTILTHAQTVSIIMSLQVPWPASIRIVIAFFSKLISMAGHRDAIQCVTSTQNVADIQLPLLVITVLFPVFICGEQQTSLLLSILSVHIGI